MPAGKNKQLFSRFLLFFLALGFNLWFLLAIFTHPLPKIPEIYRLSEQGSAEDPGVVATQQGRDDDDDDDDKKEATRYPQCAHHSGTHKENCEQAVRLSKDGVPLEKIAVLILKEESFL